MACAFETRELNKSTWADLEALFALPGGSIVRGCWCMFYRNTGQVPVGKQAGTVNKDDLCALVESCTVPGLVGYLDDAPVGWISLGPRDDYPKLRRSPVMKPVDDAEVWSVVCTFMFFGSRSLYERAGFREVVRRSPTRVVMRRRLRPRRTGL